MAIIQMQDHDCNTLKTSFYSPAEHEALLGTVSPSDVENMEKSWERCVIVKKASAVKRELSESDLVQLPTGEIIYPYWPKERLQNEAATLEFIRSNTSIPVPDCQLYIKDSLLNLEMSRIVNSVLLEDIQEASRAAAIEAVEVQMTSTILPQLRSFRRMEMGSINNTLPVIPPQRIYQRDRRSWPRISSERDEFVFCHNDLAPQNIFVDPTSFQIVGIIDWEFAGFFPQEFELPLWRGFDWEAGRKMYEEARPRDLSFFGLTPNDLQDCRIVSSHT
jgi:hypothetical protein